MALFSSSHFVNKLTPKSSNEDVATIVDPTVKGTPSTISKYVYNDIQMVKQEIKSYNEMTKVFVHNKLYYKMYKAIEQNQAADLKSLKQKHSYCSTNEYYKDLVSLYKSFLEEYDQFLAMIQCNYNNVTVKNQHQKSRKSSITSSLNSHNDDDVPDELIDPLSYELFHDPVITPSGITYEKAIILAHLQTNGRFDPLTKQPLRPDQLYPNLAVKNSVTAYLNSSH